MIGSSKNSGENYPRKCFWTQEKETRVKFNLGLSANRPSNNRALCSSWTITIHIEDFYNSQETRNTRFHGLILVDLHSFDQNILSFESFYMIIRGGNFSLFLLHLFYLYFVLLAESLRFNHSTINIKEILWFKKKLYRGKSMSKEYVSTEFNGQRISVSLHRSADRPDKLAWFTRSNWETCLFPNWVLFPLSDLSDLCLANCFQSKIFEW